MAFKDQRDKAYISQAVQYTGMQGIRVSFSLETLPNLSKNIQKSLQYFENSAQPENFSSVFHSLWWAIVTLTTVGYGDIYPVTTGGKIFTTFILPIGIGIISVPAGPISSAFSKVRNEK